LDTKVAAKGTIEGSSRDMTEEAIGPSVPLKKASLGS
jgi:hypothetical protein